VVLSFKKSNLYNMNKHFTKLLSVALLLFSWASADGQIFFLNENFNGTTGSTPPTGWSNNTLVGQTFDNWRFDNPEPRPLNSPITSPAAIFDSDNFSGGGGAEDVVLESPSFNTTGIPAITLRFDHQFEAGFGGRATVEVWDGATWTQVYNTTTQVGTTTTSLNITSIAANKADVKVRFRWRGNFSWWWMVDNVQVFYIVDVQTLSVDEPSSPCGSANDSIKVTVKNNSAFTIKNIPVSIDLSGGLLSGTQSLTLDSIVAQGTRQVTFAGGNTTAAGTLNVKAYTALVGDNTNTNDTTNFSLTIIGTPDDPTITVGSRCGAGSVMISANTSVSTDSIIWYANNPPTGAPLGRDRTFNTPSISSTTDFFAFALRGDATAKQITTTFAAGNGQQGSMFNITPQKGITIDSLTFSELNSAAGTYQIRLYYKLGTYVGNNANATAWINHGTYSVLSAGANVPLTFDINDLSLNKGQLYGMYVTIISGPQTNLDYTNGANTYSNGDITIETGIGVPGLFGGIFNPRSWNGKIHYKEAGCFSNGIAVAATINPVAAGTTLNGKSGSKGTFNGGTLVAPDVNASPDSIMYDLVTPTGFADADYGSTGTWVVSSISATTEGGFTVPASMYSLVNPTATNSGVFRLHTDTTLNDSTVCININVRRLDNGCDTVITRCVYIASRPIARFNTNTVCKGDVTEFTNTTYLQAGTLKYDWDFGVVGATSDLADPFYTYAAAGTYTVILKVETDRGYRDSITQTVAVKEIPSPNFEIINACEGAPLQFIDNSILPTGTATYTWNYGDGSTNGSGAKSTYQYAFPGIYRVKLTVEVNGCASDITRYGTQAPRSKPDFSFTTLQCDNADVSFTNLTTPPSFGNVAYTWKLGDGTIANRVDLNHTYNVFMTYDVVLISRTDLACIDSISKSLTLRESPKADFNVSGSTCNGDILTFDNITNLPAGGINSYEWEFGDANTSTDMSPTHQYVGPGVKQVTLTARNTNGCESKMVKNIAIALKPTADFVADDVCLGEETKFTNNSNIGDATPLTYEWDIEGTASTNTNEAITFATDGAKTVKLVAISSNGCNDTTTKTVEVNPKPLAVVNITSQLSFDGAFDFVTNAVGVTYKWVFGDGSIANTQNTTYKYPIDGRYIVNLIVTSDKGCIGVGTDTLFVARLGVEDNFLSNNVKLYPNPGNGTFDIEFDGINASDIKSIVVLNSIGQKVAVLDTKTILNNRININIANEAAGIYFIQVETTSGKASFKYNLVK